MAVRNTQVPGPSPIPMIGKTYYKVKFFVDPIGGMQQQVAQYGTVSALDGRFNTQDSGMLFAVGAQYNQQILSDPMLFYAVRSKSPNGSALERLMNGLVFQNGHNHKRQRRLIMPAFHRRYIDTYYDAMHGAFERLLADWQAGETRDIAKDMYDVTMEIVMHTLYGIQDWQRARAIGEQVNDWLKLFASPLAQMLRYDVPGSHFAKLLQQSTALEQTMIGVVQSRKEALTEDATDMISLLLHATDEDGKKLSEEEVIGNVHLFFLAGHETSANTLTWALFLLSQHPNIAADLLDELHAVTGGAPPTLEQLPQLKLLSWVIDETLRLMPPITWNIKFPQAPVEVGGYVLKPGSSVVISHYLTHRNPDLYPDPQTFNPYRWQNLSPSTYDYMPFSAGPRRCIGAEFAMLEMKLGLAMILPHFRLEMAAAAQIDRIITATLKPKHGMPMVIHPQDRRFSVMPVQGNVHEMVNLPR